MRNVTSNYLSAILEMYAHYYTAIIQSEEDLPWCRHQLAVIKELYDNLDNGNMKIMEASDRIIDYYDKEYREYEIDGNVEYTGETVQFGDIPPIKMR